MSVAAVVSKVVLTTAAFVLGVWAFFKTQAVTKEYFEPIMAACSSSSNDYGSVNEFAEATGYHPYDTRVGLVVLDPFICILTQFIHNLVETYPAGLLSWGAMLITSIPVTVLITLEAGRRGSTGLLLYPTGITLLCQLLGISIIFPVVWVPAYYLGANPAGSVSMQRSKMAVFFLVSPVVITMLVFVFLADPPRSLWTLLVGILAGPILPLQNLFVWSVGPPPDKLSPFLVMKNAELAATSYGLAGLVALLGWFYWMYVVLTTYSTDYESLWKDLWTEATPAVQFMTIDATILWASLVLHIGSRSLKSMMEALLYTPFFGPGAACSMALASLELASIPALSPELISGKKTT